MKTCAFLLKLGCGAALILVVGAPKVLAQAGSKNYILQNSADQKDVRQHTSILATQIQGLIDELAENGISGDDIKVLTTTKAVLNNLSVAEMQRVIASLQKASETAGTTTGERSLVDAYGGQKGIILQFRQILKEYEQRQAADELPVKFKELTDRQTQVMYTTAQVAIDSAGKGQQELDTMQQTTAQIVQSDQNALVNDVASAKQMLDKAAKDATGDQGRAMQQAQQDLQSGKLQAALDKANADLAAGHMLQATSEQKAARDQLRQLAKDLNPPTTTADALADFAATLNKIIEEQKDLLKQTAASQDVQPRVTGLDTKQGMLVDKTNSLQEDMQTLSPTTAGLVKDAMTPMQVARAVLGPNGGPFAQAEKNQQDAIDKLEQAAKQVNQQVADAEKAEEEAAKDSTQKLQDLQNQIQQAQKQQQQTTDQTAQAANANAPNALSQAQQAQNQLQQQTQNLQQAAAPLSLPASQALANAQQAMSQAQQTMNDPSQAQATQQSQQAAQQDLAQAQQAVAQQIAQNQQQATDPSQLAQAADNLQKAQTDVGNAMADATQSQQSQQPNSPQDGSQPASSPPSGSQQASSPPSGSQPASSPSSGDTPTLAQAEQALAQAAQATQAAAATPGLPDAAASAVQSAQQSIAQGQQAAKGGDAKGTASDAAAAQSALAQAQAAVAVAQAGMTPSSQPGAPAPGAPMPGAPMPGAPMPGMASMSPTPPSPNSKSKTGAKNLTGGNTQKGTLHSVSGSGSFITFQSRDRESITETQGEPRPQEYSPMIDQYLKNLSDQATDSSAQ